METNIIEQNGKRYRVTIVEEVDTPIEWDYISGHKACGLKVGDKVKALRSFENNEGGCYIVWVGEKERLIGVECEITSDAGLDGFRLKDKLNNRYSFPYFVLEKVEEPVKKQVKSYKDILEMLQPIWGLERGGKPTEMPYSNGTCIYSQVEARKITSLIKLINTAHHLNEIEFKDVDTENRNYHYYSFIISKSNDLQVSGFAKSSNFGLTRFKSEKAAQRAIQILGEETIKMALK